jgi:hypothetical protein
MAQSLCCAIGGEPVGAPIKPAWQRNALRSLRPDARAIALAPVIAEIRASGTAPYTIAAALTARGIPTLRRRWWRAFLVL